MTKLSHPVIGVPNIAWPSPIELHGTAPSSGVALALPGNWQRERRGGEPVELKEMDRWADSRQGHRLRKPNVTLGKSDAGAA